MQHTAVGEWNEHQEPRIGAYLLNGGAGVHGLRGETSALSTESGGKQRGSSSASGKSRDKTVCAETQRRSAGAVVCGDFISSACYDCAYLSNARRSDSRRPLARRSSAFQTCACRSPSDCANSYLSGTVCAIRSGTSSGANTCTAKPSSTNCSITCRSGASA